MGGLWFFVFFLSAIICVLLVVAQILLTKDEAIPIRTKIGTGIATLLALLMCVLWFRATSGMSFAQMSPSKNDHHSVTLTWMASGSPVSGYNVYRSTSPEGPFKKINSDLVRGLTYKDQDVRSGMTYYYVTRAVDSKGQESSGSNEISATIP